MCTHVCMVCGFMHHGWCMVMHGCVFYACNGCVHGVWFYALSQTNQIRDKLLCCNVYALLVCNVFFAEGFVSYCSSFLWVASMLQCGKKTCSVNNLQSHQIGD